MLEISRRYIDKYWVVPVRKLFYFHHCATHMCSVFVFFSTGK